MAFPADTSRVLSYMFPAAPVDAWRVRDDGAGPFIEAWTLPGPQPDDAAVNAAKAESGYATFLTEPEKADADREVMRSAVQTALVRLAEIKTETENVQARSDTFITANAPAIVRVLAGAIEDQAVILQRMINVLKRTL